MNRNGVQNVASAATVASWSAPAVSPGSAPLAIGIHSIVLRTGKVLIFGGYKGDEGVPETDAYLYDPATGKGTEVDPPTGVFCAGQAILSDGRVLIVGGKLSNTTQEGVTQPGAKTVYTFDPVTLQWTRQPDTPLGRCYPSVTELPDGRALITTGDQANMALNTSVEVFNLVTRQLTKVGDRTIDLYARQWVLPDGRVIVVVSHQSVQIVNPADWSWQALPSMHQVHSGYPGGVLLPGSAAGSWQMMSVGGKSAGGVTPHAEAFNAATPTSGWHYVAPFPKPIKDENLVLLPDGTVLSVGGNGKATFDIPTTPRCSTTRPRTSGSSWHRSSGGAVTTPPWCSCPTAECSPAATTAPVAGATRSRCSRRHTSSRVAAGHLVGPRDGGVQGGDDDQRDRYPDEGGARCARSDDARQRHAAARGTAHGHRDPGRAGGDGATFGGGRPSGLVHAVRAERGRRALGGSLGARRLIGKGEPGARRVS